MRKPLRDIAEIRSGAAFREAVRHTEEGQFLVVQAGDVGNDGRLDIPQLLKVSDLPVASAPLIAGQVLLQCRGQTYRAAIVPAHDRTMVATASVLILTPSPLVQPEYLAHYLNDPVTQAELRTLATGATIANLKRSALEQLQVLVPTIEDQKRIVALSNTLRVISRLEARLAELRRIELRALLEKCAERNRKRVNAPGS